MNGFVVQPHGTGAGGGTSKIKVVNANATAACAVQWRYRKGASAWSPFFEQGRTVAHLMPGNFTVNFKMKAAANGITPPPDEPVTLGTNELEMLTVKWAALPG